MYGSLFSGIDHKLNNSTNLYSYSWWWSSIGYVVLV